MSQIVETDETADESPILSPKRLEEEKPIDLKDEYICSPKRKDFQGGLEAS